MHKIRGFVYILEDTAKNKATINKVLSEYQQQFSGAGVLQVANIQLILPEYLKAGKL